MRRRQTLTFLATLGLVAGGAARASAAGPSHRVSAEQLQEQVARRFPLRYSVPGFLDFTLDAPRLRLLPELNRIGTVLLLDAAGPALRRSYSGELDLDFGLRYEAADQSIRAHRLRVHSLRMAGLPAESTAVLERAATSFAEQALLELVLHRLQARDLALPDAMGLQPGPITVTPRGLVIGFVNKPV